MRLGLGCYLTLLVDRLLFLLREVIHQAVFGDVVGQPFLM